MRWTDLRQPFCASYIAPLCVAAGSLVLRGSTEDHMAPQLTAHQWSYANSSMASASVCWSGVT
jgi:hypothetical protein